MSTDPIESIAIPNGKFVSIDLRRPAPTDVMLRIVGLDSRTLAAVLWNGTVQYDEADTDEAAAVFWRAIGRNAPGRCRSCGGELGDDT